MKKLTTALLLFITTSISAQEYEIGAMTIMETPTGAFSFKTGGSITIGEDLVVIHIKNKHADASSDYDIINERNRIIYLSDGVTTFELAFSEMSGKKKGFKYEKTVVFKQPDESTILYYVKDKR